MGGLTAFAFCAAGLLRKARIVCPALDPKLNLPDTLDIKYFENRSHALQLYVRRHRVNEAVNNYDEWELPEGAEVLPLRGNEEAI